MEKLLVENKFSNQSYIVDNNENILVCPLNWGLGHATRDVPIINEQLALKNKVIIGASGKSLLFLKKEFPNLEFINLRGYNISYAKKPFFLFWIVLQLPFFAFSILREHIELKKIIKQHHISKVISDNRYGLWNKKIKSVIITHQIFIKLPKSLKCLESILHFFTRIIINKFDECLIPDYKQINESLSGELSHGKKIPKNAKYIGALSRFKNYKSCFTSNIIPNVLVLISGPEPHRTQFEKQIEQQYSQQDKKVLIVCGLPEEKIVKSKYSNIEKQSHLSTDELYFYLQNSYKIIARSGYSTIMDLHVLGKSAKLYPTPGQTEQEYLLKWITKQKQ